MQCCLNTCTAWQWIDAAWAKSYISCAHARPIQAKRNFVSKAAAETSPCLLASMAVADLT